MIFFEDIDGALGSAGLPACPPCLALLCKLHSQQHNHPYPHTCPLGSLIMEPSHLAPLHRALLCCLFQYLGQRLSPPNLPACASRAWTLDPPQPTGKRRPGFCQRVRTQKPAKNYPPRGNTSINAVAFFVMRTTRVVTLIATTFRRSSNQGRGREKKKKNSICRES